MFCTLLKWILKYPRGYSKDPHGFFLKSQISKWWLFIIIWLVLIIFDVVESSDVDVFMFCTLLMWVFSWKIHIRTFYNIILIKNNRITINNHCFKVEMISGKSTWIFEHSLNIHVDIWKSTSAKYKTCKIHIRTFKNSQITMKNNSLEVSFVFRKIHVDIRKSTWIFEKSTSAKYKTWKFHIRTLRKIKHYQNRFSNLRERCNQSW